MSDALPGNPKFTADDYEFTVPVMSDFAFARCAGSYSLLVVIGSKL